MQVHNIGNSYCDIENNKPECNFDGGDCCDCTCQPEVYSDDGAIYTSGCEEFACVDPAAPCVDDDEITVDTIENCPNVRQSHGALCYLVCRLPT